MSRAYFTIVGSNDPQSRPGGRQGPALDLLEALLLDGIRPDEIRVAWTPGVASEQWPGGYDEQKAALVEQCSALVPEARVSDVTLPVRPNSSVELLPALAAALDDLRVAGQDVHVNTSSGTPQMLETLKVLRGTGWLPPASVRLWQIDRQDHRLPGVPHHRETVTPYLEEHLRLAGAFAALRRFDFAGGRDAFRELGAARLELPGRQQKIVALSQIAGALLALDDRDASAAQTTLGALTLPVLPLQLFNDLLVAGSGGNPDALVWLTWGRYDRAAAQQRTADALIWAVILHEQMVVKILDLRGLKGRDAVARRDLPAGVFEQLKLEVPTLFMERNGKIRCRKIEDKMCLLNAPTMQVQDAHIFDAHKNAGLGRVRSWRNRVAHAGVTPDGIALSEISSVVDGLIQAFPFQSTWARTWAAQPDTAAVSALSMHQLIDDLQVWVT
jgi:hypothetical protein